MDPVSVRMVRAALIWLAIGFTLGGLMLADSLTPGNWRVWFAPTHGHILFVGWFLQFAVGIAYWLLPRKRTAERPFGYHEGAAFLSMVILNFGLGMRALIEPATRMGFETSWTNGVLVLSALAHIAAIGIIVVQLWYRVVERKALRNRGDAAGSRSPEGRRNASGTR